MYGLPKEFDASIFLGRNLEQVSFSANTIHFYFDRGMSIRLESSFQHIVQSDTDELDEASVPVEKSRLMQLTGATVVRARAEDLKTLSLEFDNDQVLRIFDDSPQYESFHIQYGDSEIIV